jgi:hypothetical protein
MSARNLLALLVLAAVSVSCHTSRRTRPAVDPPPPALRPTVIDYVDEDGFDEYMETALTSADPVIQIHTECTKPDWGARLNAWLAAWNMGGKVELKARMQAPVTVNAATIRELRLLIDDLMGRAEKLARAGSTWIGNERMLRHRVELLQPYNLRFHMDRDGFLQIILFNGRYSEYHRDYVRATAHPDDDLPEEWVRGWSCSRCRPE